MSHRELCRAAAWAAKRREEGRQGNAFVLFYSGNDPSAIPGLMDSEGEHMQLFPAIRMLLGGEAEWEQGCTWLRKYFYKGSSLYACYSGKYLDLHGVCFVFNYSLLVKRTSRPDGYRPDCKCCCEDLYLTVQEVAMILPLAFHITPWAARSIMKYQFSVELWDAVEGFV